jgi:hypothetical protein
MPQEYVSSKNALLETGYDEDYQFSKSFMNGEWVVFTTLVSLCSI